MSEYHYAYYYGLKTVAREAVSTSLNERIRLTDTALLFFVDTSVLKAALTGTVLADIFKTAFNPRIQLTPIRDPSNYKNKVLGTISVKLYGKGPGSGILSSTLAPAMRSGNWTLANEDTSLMRQYLKSRIGQEFYQKFTGPAKAPQNRRPWLGPLMAFWVLNEAPKVVALAAANALKNK